MNCDSDKPRPKTSDEFEKFEQLTRRLVSVPKKDVEKEEKKFKKSQEKKRRV